nr:hypothetical protein [Granulosicoccus sp.]
MTVAKSTAIIFALSIIFTQQQARSETLGLIPTLNAVSIDGSSHAIELGYYSADNFSHVGLRYHRNLDSERAV